MNTIIGMVLALGVIILVHEWGHFIAARFFGVRVDVFSIGFGPELFGWTDRRGTRWKFSALPLGGYVKMFGDSNVMSLPDGTERSLTAAEQAVSFHHKSLGRRALVAAAGPFANFLFAVVVLAVRHCGLLFGRTGAVCSRLMTGQGEARGDRSNCTPVGYRRTG
jgi:regulator of sigma E protease